MEELAKVGAFGITFGAVFAAGLLLVALVAASMQSSRISREEEKWQENR